MLGTPPAFILSQDQTLMLKVFPCQNYLAFHLYLLQISLLQTFLDLTVLFGSILSNLICSPKFFLEFSGLHYCLFVKVLCCSLFSGNFCILSLASNFVNNFFYFFNFFVEACRYRLCTSATRRSISPHIPLVNTIF